MFSAIIIVTSNNTKQMNEIFNCNKEEMTQASIYQLITVITIGPLHIC